MKIQQLFKLLIDISFYLLIPVIFLFPGAIVYTLIFPDQELIKLTAGTISVSKWSTALILLGIYVEYVIFFVGFYNLRKFSALLLKNKIFSTLSIKRTKKIGLFFTICGASTLVLRVLYALIFSSEFRLEFGFSDVQLFLFLTIIGVFFLILSSAFERAMQLEEETKLTV
ncbi:MAG: DUF2975 domain-containing protein [Leeuwenhoekiella sp.]